VVFAVSTQLASAASATPSRTWCFDMLDPLPS
jgi:hypothetical protein